jgi:hypothetical protein
MTPFVIASRTSATDLPEKSSRSAAFPAAAPAWLPRAAAVPARLRALVAVVRLREVPARELEARFVPPARELDARLVPPERAEPEREEDDRELDERDDEVEERELDARLVPPEREPPERDEPDELDDERDPPERDPPERDPPERDEPDERELDDREPEDDERELDEPPDLRLLDDPPLPPDDSAMTVLPETKFGGTISCRARRRAHARGRSSPKPRSTISADSPRLPRCGRRPSCTATS